MSLYFFVPQVVRTAFLCGTFDTFRNIGLARAAVIVMRGLAQWLTPCTRATVAVQLRGIKVRNERENRRLRCCACLRCRRGRGRSCRHRRRARARPCRGRGRFDWTAAGKTERTFQRNADCGAADELGRSAEVARGVREACRGRRAAQSDPHHRRLAQPASARRTSSSRRASSALPPSATTSPTPLWSRRSMPERKKLATIIPASVARVALDGAKARARLRRRHRGRRALVVGADGRRSICREAPASTSTRVALRPGRDRHQLPPFAHHDGVSTELHHESGSVTTVPLPDPRARA